MNFTSQPYNYGVNNKQECVECTKHKVKEKTKEEETLEENKKKYIEKHGYYWKGPLDIKIPISITKVPTLDNIHNIVCTFTGITIHHYTN